VKPQNDSQALALALVLRITASESDAKACVKHAELISSRMEPAQARAVRDAVQVCLEILLKYNAPCT
jgi:hypothetical protein